MTVDIKQFLQTFFEETTEMLQDAEQALLTLDINAIDNDHINRIFRTMHSLKGSSAIFGFQVLSNFTHKLESYLDEIRSGKHKIDKNDIDNLLQAIDCLRICINSLKANAPIDESLLNQVLDRIENQDQGQQASKRDPENIAASNTASTKFWKIIYHPRRDVFQKNNDILRLFAVLGDTGKIKVTIDINKLPPFPNFNPSECFCQWQIQLTSDISKEEILEYFLWITDENDLTILPISTANDYKVGNEFKKSALITPSTTQDTSISVRVATDKIDNIINMVGELIITQSMLNQITKNFTANKIDKLNEALSLLEQNSRQLQASVMQIRMIPVENIFNRVQRMIYDIAKRLNKEVKVIITGEQTEIDKNMAEKLGEPILHLVRNAIDHGIENVEVRKNLGKPEVGEIQLNAYQESGHIVIEVADDGSGLNKDKIKAKAISLKIIETGTNLTEKEIYQLIFQPAFSTSDSVSEISGRGVGLDVVYKNINSIGGEIEIETIESVGTIFRLHLPLTLVIMDSQLVRVSKQTFSLPLIDIIEIIEIESEKMNRIDDQTFLYHYRGDYIPIIYLNEIYNLKSDEPAKKSEMLIIVSVNNQIAGIVVEEMLSQQQIVIKNIDYNYTKINGISGATILGDGRMALVVDVKAVVDLSHNKVKLNTQEFIRDQEMFDPDNDPMINGNTIQLLIFELAGQVYGINTLIVSEIRIWEEETVLPNSPSYVKGVINVRGSIIPVIDLSKKFTLSPLIYDKETVIIIVTTKTNKKSHHVGIIVDKVVDTYTVNTTEIMPLKDTQTSVLKDHIQGLVTVNDHMITVLNLNNIIAMSAEQEVVV